MSRFNLVYNLAFNTDFLGFNVVFHKFILLPVGYIEEVYEVVVLFEICLFLKVLAHRDNAVKNH